MYLIVIGIILIGGMLWIYALINNIKRENKRYAEVKANHERKIKIWNEYLKYKTPEEKITFLITKCSPQDLKDLKDCYNTATNYINKALNTYFNLSY